MLYDSTKSLLQSILRALETGDQTRWDDQTESANACLYEMHQMSRSLYRPYKSDRLNANSLAQSTLPDKLCRAIPHVRTMAIAIRHRDEARALESGKAALAEMNGTSHSAVSSLPPAPALESPDASKASGSQKLTGKHRLPAKVRKVTAQAAASGGM